VLWGTDVGTWRWNVETGETVVNARWGEMVGLDLKRVGETTIQLMESLTHPDDLEIARRRLEEHFRDELAVYECELRMRHADGHWVWVLDRGRVVHRDAEGRPLWMSGIHLDISRRKSAQVALEEAHESLRKFASRIPGMVYQYRQYPDGRISFPYSSDVVLDLFGLHPHEIREDGARIFAPLHPDDLPRVLALIDTCIREVAPWRDHFRVIRPDGSIRWLEGESDPELLPDGSILCHGHIRDITGRREFEHQVQMLSMAIEQSPESIVITDANGLIEFVNAAFLHSTGYEREALIGKNPRILQSGETPASTYTAMWAALSNGQCWRGELINRRKSGERYYEFAVIAPIRNADGQVTNFLAIKDDITEKKRMGEELTAYRHHLEDLVAERTRQLAEARQRADAANVAKSSFLANMSHEIRTPLNAILGNSHLLGRGTLDALQRRQLDQLEKAGKHLLGVINDILDLSKIEAGRLSMELRPFSLRELVEEVAAILAPSAQAKGLRIETSLRCPEDAFIGDAVRIRQALINYVRNAIKFSSQGTIRLECHATGKTDGKTNLRFAVTDTGVGIAPETLARLFQPFEQADATITRRFGGTGLGLAIVRHLVSLMGGHVGAESQPGMGSTFWFSLPLAKAAAPAEDTPTPSPHLRTPRKSYAMQRVLLVEDHPTNREVGRAILEALGLAVTTACDGREAVERVAEEAFDLVLMDMQMPVLDGLSATLEIRRLPGRESLPIVAMTANVFEEDRQACLSAGMDDFLTKPIEPDRLQATLDRWLPVDPSRPQGAAPHVARPEGDRAGTAVAALQRLGDLGHLDGIRTRVVAGGRADRHLDLLRNFLHQHVAEIDALGITGGSLPTTDVPRLAHAIKGAAANLGLVRIAEVAHRLESGAAPLATLHNACREVLEVIEAVGAEALSGPHAPLTMAPVDDATLASFRELLAASDARAIRLFHEHGAGFEQRFGNRAMGLSSLLDRFDFPGVMALLDAPEGAGDADGNQPPQPPQQTDGR
jgi:PAS domain S-box-containing protein